MATNKREYTNEYFSVLGDSISTFEGVSVPKHAVHYDMAHKLSSGVVTAADTWWGQTIERLGGKLLMNNSFSGSTVSRLQGCEIASYGCSDERTRALGLQGELPDVIFVFLGINDWGMGVPVQPEQDEADGVFACAYACMLEKLQANYPNAEIFCFTLPWLDHALCFNARTSLAYSRAIAQTALKHGCRVVHLDDYDMTGDTEDGVHPNRQGMQKIADLVVAELLGGIDGCHSGDFTNKK